MTARTSPVYNPYTTAPQSQSEKVNPVTTEDNNRPSSTKSINQPVPSANRDTEFVITNYNRPAYRGKRRLATEDDSDNKDTERKQDIKGDEEDRKSVDSGCRRGVNLIEERANKLNNQLEELDVNWGYIPHKVGEVGTKMASTGNRVDELAWRNKLNSAKIHELERELKHVKLENDKIKGRFYGDEARLQNGRHHSEANDYEETQHRDHGQTYRDDMKHGGDYLDSHRTDHGQRPVGKPTAKNEQHRLAHGHGEDEEGNAYWGFNKFYSPQYATSYRREHVPYHTLTEEKAKQSQYADDYNYIQEKWRREEEAWRERRRLEEQRWMKEKPKTYDYTAPFQALNPPRDINRFFHDSKYKDGGEREQKPDEYYFARDVPYYPSATTGMTIYETRYVNPSNGLRQIQPGGLYIIRFHDQGFDNVKLALNEQQTIVKSYNGIVLGIAGKHNVVVLDGDADWRVTKEPAPYRQHVVCKHQCCEDAIAVLWFPSREKAFEFFSNSFRNRFKQQGFPTSHSWEGHYVPLLTPPFVKELDTYLIIELLNAGKYPQENIQQFEAEARQEILNEMPNSLPFIASAFKGREDFKPGPMFKDKSKVFISRFDCMHDLTKLWKSGIIHNQFRKWNLTGPVSVFAMSLKDWTERNW